MTRLVGYFSLGLAALFHILPQRLSLWGAQFLAFLWVDVLRIRKKVMLDNMHIAFPDVDVSTKKSWMKKSVFILARNLFDLFQVPFINEKWIKKNVIFHGTEELEKHPGGLFFLCMHMASGDLLGTIVSHHLKPISVITKRFRSPIMDEFWFSLRRKSSMQFIDAHGKANAFDILKALKNGRAVAFVLDQFMGKPYGIETDFFGRKTGTAYGLALFAQKTKRPVLPLYAYWDKNGRFNVVIKPAVDLSGLLSDDIERNNVLITNRFNQEIEQAIKAHPDHWLWVHKRWKVFE